MRELSAGRVVAISVAWVAWGVVSSVGIWRDYSSIVTISVWGLIGTVLSTLFLADS